MARVAVVGAGLAGLTAAVALKRRRHKVTLLEAAEQPGGVVQSVRHGGFLADLGPNSMLAPPRMVQGLLSDLGLERQRVDADARARRRYIVRGGKPRAVPGSPLGLVTTGLFSPRAKLRIVTEPFRPKRLHGSEESLAQLIRRRLGQELVDYALNPMVAGIYAGDPERLSAAHAMPSIGALETRYGSLIGGIRGLMKARHADRTEPEGRLFSFREGMAAIPRALTATLNDELELATRVTGIAPVAEAWRLSIAGPRGERHELFDAVIWAAPAYAMADVPFQGEDDLWQSLSDIPYAPVAVTVSGYHRSAVRHPLDGFGMLVPGVEHRQTLGTLFSSSMFPDRAPPEHVTLTTFTGGARQPQLVAGGMSAVESAVDADLRELLGVTGPPLFRVTALYPRAIPQYNLGHATFLARIERLEAQHPGLFFAGSYRNGVAVAEVMTSGALAAEAADAMLRVHAPRAIEVA